jgi:hypothetical protein
VRKRKAWHTARSSPRDVVSDFVPQYLKRNMGALLSIVSAGNAGKPLHHVETHCECACSDTSESSEESKNKHEPSSKALSSDHK